MFFQIAANLIVLVHLAFIVFVMLGALLALRWRWIVWLHLPAVVWGALIEFAGWICPLTPFENRLREAGGNAGYNGGFVEHYLVPIVYPTDLTRETQVYCGAVVLVVNLAIYGWLWTRSRQRAGSGHKPA